MKKIMLAAMMAALMLLSACGGKANKADEISFETFAEIEQYINDNLPEEIKSFISDYWLHDSYGKISATIHTIDSGGHYIPPVAKAVIPLLYEKSNELKLEVKDITVNEFTINSSGKATNMISWDSTDGLVGHYRNEVAFGKPEKYNVSIDELFELLDGYATIPDSTLSAITNAINEDLSKSYHLEKVSVNSSEYKGKRGDANISITATVEQSDDIAGDKFSLFVSDALSCIAKSTSENEVTPCELILQMDAGDTGSVFWVSYDGRSGTLTDTRPGLELVSKVACKDIANLLNNR